MAKLDYNTMLKADWQKLAGEHKIEFKAKSTVRYLVEKIAEKIGVDDKIVDDEDLKKAVCEKLNTPAKKKTTTKKATAKKTTAKKTSKPKKSKIETLREECDALGLGWGEKHTEADLEQLINAVKGAGISPSIELDVDKLDEIRDVNETPEPFNPVVENAGMQTFNDTQQPIANDPTEVDESNLDIYRKSFTNTIRGHWRVMGLNEVQDLFNQANYPFKHEIKRHPHNSNQIEIILTSSGKSKRIPSDNEGDWITING